MKKSGLIWIVTACLSAITGEVLSQDMQFTQYFSAPMYLNPAFTGANVCSRVSSNLRTQWPAVGYGYSSQILAMDHYFINYNFGGGLMFTNDVAGTGRLKTTTFSGLFAYNATINRKLAFRLGLEGGMRQRSVHFSSLTFGDQLSTGSTATRETPTQNVTNMDISTGLLVYSSQHWGGIALHHLNKPNESLLGDEAVRPLKFSFHGGTRFILEKKTQELEASRTISLTFNYRSQMKYDQLDLGAYFSRGALHAGIWYRGIPLFKSYKKGYPNNDAICFILGVEKNRFKMGYSYDVTISWLRGNTSGAHELSLAYEMCKQKKKKKKYAVVICPKF